MALPLNARWGRSRRVNVVSTPSVNVILAPCPVGVLYRAVALPQATPARANEHAPHGMQRHDAHTHTRDVLVTAMPHHAT